MFRAADIRPFATVEPVTVLLGVVLSDGVAIAADRAAVLAGEECAPGVPMLAEDRCKLFVTAADVAVGIAGHISAPTATGQPSPDLLRLTHAASGNTHTPSATAAAIRDVFESYAAVLCAAYGQAASRPQPDDPQVLTTAFVGGRVATGDAARPWAPHMLEVALLADGTVVCRPIRGEAAYGPQAAAEDLRRWMTQAAEVAALRDAVISVRALIESAHRKAPALVTPDFDTAQVPLAGPAQRTHHPYLPPRPPRF